MSKVATKDFSGGATKPRIIWRSAGLHLTERNSNGWLEVSPDLLRAYFTRPEVHPVPESCDAEHRIFERLMDDPFAQVSQDEIDAIQDVDAAENYRIVMRFRDHLVRFKTIEAAYSALFTLKDAPRVPPVFIGQMAHLIVANVMAPVRDPFAARAAELFFRDQKVTSQDGQLLLADSEMVEMYAETGGFGGLGSLLSESGTTMRSITLDVLQSDNDAQYWERADQFNFALDFRYTENGPDGFARVLERWVNHFHGLDCRVQAMQSIKDSQWSWHVGLDAEASRILNALYEGAGRGSDINYEGLADQNRIVGLFRMEIKDRNRIQTAMRGKAVYLGLAMDQENTVRMKPQNLIVNLPLAKAD